MFFFQSYLTYAPTHITHRFGSAASTSMEHGDGLPIMSSLIPIFLVGFSVDQTVQVWASVWLTPSTISFTARSPTTTAHTTDLLCAKSIRRGLLRCAQKSTHENTLEQLDFISIASISEWCPLFPLKIDPRQKSNGRKSSHDEHMITKCPAEDD